MAHMQNEITGKQLGWAVETKYGTCHIPGEVQTVPDYLVARKQIDSDDLIFDALAEVLQPYCDSEIASIEVICGYFARLSAPGYLDCTDWTCYATKREAIRALRDI